MNTISNSMVHVAMDGQTLYKSQNLRSSAAAVQNSAVVQKSITPTGAQVAQNLEQTLAEVKADSQELQKMSQMVAGNKLQFNVNKELDMVVVSVVDSSTNQVVKQFPSEEIVNLKLRIRKAIGNMFNDAM
ncbi:MAG: flagellar protein FlaG [Treponema sp.]|nr:flagellar protein FlaG [Treponema sp.]